MSEGTSKFGMLRSLQQAASEEKATKQESTKTAKHPAPERPEPQPDPSPATELKHYSSYMPMPLFAQLQIYVARRKAARGKAGEKVSIQSVIAEAVREYLDKHDK